LLVENEYLKETRKNPIKLNSIKEKNHQCAYLVEVKRRSIEANSVVGKEKNVMKRKRKLFGTVFK